jgi:REP element-mobilizing transposase RayT
MRNHVHVVVGVPGDPDPATLLRDFKSYAARGLNARWSRPESGTWWTRSGSRRVLRDDVAVHAAVDYVRRQHGALAVAIDPLGEPTA